MIREKEEFIENKETKKKGISEKIKGKIKLSQI